MSSDATLELRKSSMDQKHSYDPADGFPRIMPSLRYDDVERALTWLRDVFGLSEHLRWTSPEGEVLHAEMTLGDAFVELAHSSDDQPSPQALGASSTVLVAMVKDVDSHYRHTAAAGARIIAPLEDKPWGLRQIHSRGPGGTSLGVLPTDQTCSAPGVGRKAGPVTSFRHPEEEPGTARKRRLWA